MEGNISKSKIHNSNKSNNLKLNEAAPSTMSLVATTNYYDVIDFIIIR